MIPLSSRLPQYQSAQSSTVSPGVATPGITLPALSTPSHVLLLDFLTIRHGQLDAAAPTMDLVTDTFRQFAVFLADEQDIADWLPTLRNYAYSLMDRLDRPRWQVDWCLRSSDFAQLAARVLA